MKKLLFVLLTAALALPMTAQLKGQAPDFRTGKVSAPAITTLQRSHAVVANRDEVPAGYASVTLNAADVWEDGTGYQMLLDADATAYGTIIPETGGLTTGGDAPAGVYDEFEYKIPENADGALTTANILIDEAVTILIPAGVYDWCITNPTPGDRLWIASSNGTIPGRYDDFEFVDGGIYTFYVTFGGQNDQVDLEIFDPLAPVMPVNVTADENGNVAWENDHDPAFNLRYRPYDPNMAVTKFWDFETDESLEGWWIYDADGDGYNWGLYDLTDYGHGYSLTSASYSGGALSPDNWAFTPLVPGGGSLSFWAGNYSSSFLDQFAVYWVPGDVDYNGDGDIEAYIADAVMISDGMITPEYYYNGGATYEIDLTAYRGEGRIAFRHFDCTDEWRLFIDEVTYNIPGNEPGEWTVVEGIEGNDYLIEGLEDGVTYEVQVQAIGEDGRITDWTEPVLFTYEAGQVPPQPTEKTGAPLFNGYTTDGIHAYFIEILESEPSVIYFRVQYNDGEFTEWAEYEDILSFTEDGKYRVEAYAIADGKLASDPVAYEFYVSPFTGLSEVANGKTVAGVRYYNMAGQEMQEANGMTIVVTTYTDGTTSAAKVIK